MVLLASPKSSSKIMVQLVGWLVSWVGLVGWLGWVGW